MDNGFFSLHRKIFDNPIWKKPALAHLVVHLIGKANHETKRFIFNGHEQEVKRGQLLTGRYALSEETGISPSSTRNYLKILENIGFLDIKSTNKFSLITLTKYSQYQDKKKKEDSTLDNQRTTTGQQLDTNNNVNNENNIATKKVAKGFRDIKQLTESKSKHLQLIGFYFTRTKKDFDTPEELNVAVKRWMKDASAIAKFSEDKINKAFEEAQDKHPVIWTLGTVLKILTK